MWADRASPEQLEALIQQLRRILPAPPAQQQSSVTPLRARPSLEQVAELLHREPGFAWISGADGARLLHHPIATISYDQGSATMRGPAGDATLHAWGFDVLEAMLAAWGGPAGAVLAGFLSYDLAAELEDLGPEPALAVRFPKLSFGLFDATLRFDGGRWSLSSTDAWRSPLTAAQAEELLQRAETIELRVLEAPCSTGPMSSRPDQGAFESSVGRIVEHIYAGEIFQTNLCRAIETAIEPSAAWSLFRRMRSISAARHEAFLSLDGGRSIASISPETFLTVEAFGGCGGRVESRPIKGTRPRGADAAQDRALVAELAASEKDRAELAMIVDVVRNDLARVCEPGSVKVAGHAELMELPTVHHLFSTVRGKLRSDAGIAGLLRASFPPASISGAPKIEAMRIAQREEGQQRGPCMGAIGWISLDGRAELSVAIRTAFVSGSLVRYYAGCGITADSDPAAEFEESRHKAAAFVRALGREREAGW